MIKPLASKITNIPAECSITSGGDEFLVKGPLAITINYHEEYGLQTSFDVFTTDEMNVVCRKAINSKYTRGQIFFSPIYNEYLSELISNLTEKAKEEALNRKLSICKFRSDIKECCNE